ncbi:VOC family protein [Pseudoduganella sp. FT93W]|uniref:VOC family protein n=1 Tax=Duganella fentianensis TaxID=2692177 RepID=A0A845HYH6_9BURK|nr:VOC family protein [Duganella fentianensis]MYN43538.1 VOC family protein [Duganella fentianensis]
MEWNKLVPECVVANYERSKKFYIEVFGFKLMFERPESRFGYLDLDGAQIMLLEGSHMKTPGQPDMHPNEKQFHFQIEVEKLAPLIERLAAHEVSLIAPCTESWYRVDELEHGQIEFFVADPDGFLFRFYEPLGERPVKSSAVLLA